jgi:protocatechuate 3,4-dioxygenase beta subunit
MERKDFIKGIGLVGLGQFLQQKQVTSVVPGESMIAACTISPSETAGPYPYPGAVASDYTGSALYRSNIIGDLPNAGGGGAITGARTAGGGIVMTLTLTLQNTSCVPIPDARVDIWHCDKRGYYSAYSSSQNGGDWTAYTFLRGIQTTDTLGQVTFTTIFPGWYIPRATHIHAQVYVDGALKLTTQLAFPETPVNVSTAAGATSYYNRTYPYANATDQVFSDTANTINEMLTVTGTPGTGYVASGLLVLDYALPVKLVSFEAAIENRQVLLSWATTEEDNASHFEIGRAADAGHFTSIGIVNAANVSGSHQYGFTDHEPLAGNGYYRLKMVDLDGTYAYSRIIAVSSEMIGTLSVYPNPVADEMTVEHIMTDSDSWAAIYNVGGLLLAKSKLQSGTSYTRFDVSKLSPGVYLLVITVNALTESTRFTVQ